MDIQLDPSLEAFDSNNSYVFYVIINVSFPDQDGVDIVTDDIYSKQDVIDYTFNSLPLFICC